MEVEDDTPKHILYTAILEKKSSQFNIAKDIPKNVVIYKYRKKHL